VAVEVKTRRGRATGHPAEAVDARRRSRIARAAAFLLETRRAKGETIRFDVVSVFWPPGDDAPRLEHLPGAFDAPDERRTPR
jgi:putative endonuclease